MGEYISRQAAIDAIEEMQIPIMRSEFSDEQLIFTGMSEALAAIKGLRTAQQDIIRCEDCKNWHVFAYKKFGYCTREYFEDDGRYRLKVETTHDDFCSYAERKGGKDE